MRVELLERVIAAATTLGILGESKHVETINDMMDEVRRLEDQIKTLTNDKIELKRKNIRKQVKVYHGQESDS